MFRYCIIDIVKQSSQANKSRCRLNSSLCPASLMQRPVQQVVPVRDFKVRDDEAIRRAVSRSNVVINLLGLDKETMNFSFEDVHIDAAARIARISAENGILERFLHVSHIGAAADHPSRRLRTKVGRAGSVDLPERP